MADIAPQADGDGITAVVKLATNEFIEQGSLDDVLVLRVRVPRNPDPRRERYSGDVNDPIRVATAEEITAYDSKWKDDRVEVAFHSVELRAVLYTAMWFVFNRPPTDAEIADAKVRFRQVFKALI